MLNKVQLIGNLGKDPEIRVIDSGSSVANFTLATTEKYTNKSGEKVENTEWHNIVVWNKNLIPIIERYVFKGSKLYIEGKLKTRTWEDKNGAKHYTTEIVMNDFDSKLILLSSKHENSDNGNEVIRQNTPSSKMPIGFNEPPLRDDVPPIGEGDLPFN